MRALTLTISLLFVGATQTRLAQAAAPEVATLHSAATVLDEIMSIPVSQIPASMLADAAGIAIVPGVIKGGFVLGARHGRGVVVARDTNGNWQAPVFVTLTGGSVGWQIGVQSTDVILVFRTRRSIEGILNGKFTIGADAAVAAGPVGRQAAAATDERLKAEIYSYCRSRGIFAGVSIDGSVLQVDRAANAALYRPAHAGGGATMLHPAALKLLARVAHYTRTDAAPPNMTIPHAPTQEAPRDYGTNAARTQRTRTQVAQAFLRLSPLLDERWNQYLALPAEVFENADHPSAAALRATVERYNSIADNPRYRTLTMRGEFRAVHQVLRRYLNQLAANPLGGRLDLPPPPADALPR